LEQLKKTAPCQSDEYYMRQALKEARKALLLDETPVGAVIVHAGRITARGYNKRECYKDSTLHAEMIAIKKASRKLDSWRLNECTMYVTLEPCIMCAGAMIQARVGRLFVGAMDPKAGCAGSVLNIVEADCFNHKVQVTYGILEAECSEILKDFFRDLRKRKKLVRLQE